VLARSPRNDLHPARRTLAPKTTRTVPDFIIFICDVTSSSDDDRSTDDK
jgi:hypothetical protein